MAKGLREAHGVRFKFGNHIFARAYDALACAKPPNRNSGYSGICQSSVYFGPKAKGRLSGEPFIVSPY